MKVRELIRMLEQLDQDKMIVIDGYEGGCNFPEQVHHVQINVDEENTTDWYYGKYDFVLPGDEGYVPGEWNSYLLKA
jgi:hypothetical protein